MQQRLARQLVLDYLDAFYTGDVLRALDCCDDEIDSITYAPVELFPHLGRKHGKAWVVEAIRIQQRALSDPTLRIGIHRGRWIEDRHHAAPLH
jgi:hypothetical protein